MNRVFQIKAGLIGLGILALMDWGRRSVHPCL